MQTLSKNQQHGTWLFMFLASTTEDFTLLPAKLRHMPDQHQLECSNIYGRQDIGQYNSLVEKCKHADTVYD